MRSFGDLGDYNSTATISIEIPTEDMMNNKVRSHATLSQEFVRELLTSRDGPCLSLYQTTHRHHPDAAQDSIRFKNLISSARRSLETTYPEETIAKVLKPLEALIADRGFSGHVSDGLAVFATPSYFSCLQVAHPFREFVVVANSFHIKPLLRAMQSADRYQVLCLSQHSVALYEGSRYSLQEFELHQDVPLNLIEALGSELTEPNLGSYNGNGAAGPGMYYGHGGRSEEEDKDLPRYLRAIDRAILKHHSEIAKLPLILVALHEEAALFREISHNRFLTAQGINQHPDTVDKESLRQRAWALFEPQYQERISKAVDRFKVASAHNNGSCNLNEIADAATAGRISSILVESDRYIGGRIHETGKIETSDLIDPTIDDLLDDLAEKVIQTGGEVIVIPSERMPSDSGAAATYRY